MKILHYNWVDYLDPEKRGGGVTVYQHNLINAFGAAGDVDVYFISSGISYDLRPGKPRWDHVRHGPPQRRERRFEIINSGVLSPAHHSFGNPSQISEPETEAAFFDFIEKKGPFDVIHFNNLEGLPADVLKLKQRWPGTRVICSLHNYYPVCPQVNLWFREEENCTDYRDGRRCAACLPHKPEERLIRLANATAFNMKKRGIKPGSRVFDKAFRPALRIGARLVRLMSRNGRAKPAAAAPQPAGKGALMPIKAPPFQAFATRRARFVDNINTYCDKVLCVSARVAHVAHRHGIDEALLETCYIGTRQAARFAETAPRDSILGADGTLTLAYMGYMRRDKGFYFLLDALETLEPEMASRLRLIVCARRGDTITMDRMAALQNTLGEVLYADGYTHDELDDILAQVDVGLVPVLWEDNLPQVAIEMHARHIPLLTSDLGGAQELANFAPMVFRAGDVGDFHARLRALLNGEITQEAYWAKAMAPMSMEDHIARLMRHYGAGETPA